MALTWGDLNGKVHDKIIPTVADVIYKSSPVFIRIRTQNAQQFDGGVKIRQNIGYAELNGGPFGRGQSFDTAYVPTDTAFEVNPKFYYVNISLYGTDDVLARGAQQAVPFVGSKIANAAGKMAKLIATDLYLDGLGTGSSTLSIDGFNQWFDNGNTFTSVGGITRTDVGVSNGTNSQGVNGYVASLSSGFTLKAVEIAMGSAWFGREHVDLLVSDQNSWNWFFNKLQPMQRFNEESSDVAKSGFRSFQFVGAQVVVDQYAPTGSMYGINSKSENLAFYSSTLKRYQFGFTGFKEIYNSDDRSGQYLWAGNMIVSNPRYNFRLTNIPTLS
jgi:hypothetical protein